MEDWKHIQEEMRSELGFSSDQWVMWVAVLDKRTSLDCLALNGCCFTFGNMPEWPGHPNCRCRLVPISRPVLNLKSLFIVDERKFTEYLFGEKGYETGKAQLFERWGYFKSDAELLKEIYTEQAMKKYRENGYKLGKLDDYGQRVDIYIELTDDSGMIRIIKSAWMVESDGSLRLVTPFAGK